MLKDLLGGLSPSLFLKRHWQQQPLLIRQAIPGFRDLLSPRQLMSLAGHDMCQARVVITEGSRTEVHYGPFSLRTFRDLPTTQWTLLVQGVNHVLPAADRLLRRFSFLPFSRLDDLMVSYAVPEFTRSPAVTRLIHAGFAALGEPLHGAIGSEDFAEQLAHHGFVVLTDTGNRTWASEHAGSATMARVFEAERLMVAERILRDSRNA